jgi:hypothetical protein
MLCHYGGIGLQFVVQIDILLQLGWEYIVFLIFICATISLPLFMSLKVLVLIRHNLLQIKVVNYEALKNCQPVMGVNDFPKCHKIKVKQKQNYNNILM